MPEYYGPLGQSFEAARDTKMRETYVLSVVERLPSSQLLRLVLDEKLPSLRAAAIDELGGRLDAVIDSPVVQYDAVANPNAQLDSGWSELWRNQLRPIVIEG